MNKSTPEELRERFNEDVERFVNVDEGQSSMMDAKLAINLFEQACSALNPNAQAMCDIGCGGGNFALRVLRRFPKIAVSLVDLSPKMLDRATQRITDLAGRVMSRTEGDIREITLPPESFDIVTAAAVLHHLRSHDEWANVLSKIYASLRPGGTFWLWDLIRYDNPQLQSIQMQHYAEFLTKQDGEIAQQEIFERIERSDSPETTPFIAQALRTAGFSEVEILHKDSVFCLLYAKK